MPETYMRASKTAIGEMPISQRTPPQTGPVTGRAVAKDDVHIAVATAANSFSVIPSTSLGRELQIGERVSLRFQRGLPSLEDDRTQARWASRSHLNSSPVAIVDRRQEFGTDNIAVEESLLL
ncbi:MAG TPA: hypothetical protein VHY84_01340 [Bryobacteraceae bacterium]|jgi:hypothetical protein|nr:hypothetical protein [Bryobacteraceae bacterium]